MFGTLTGLAASGNGGLLAYSAELCGNQIHTTTRPGYVGNYISNSTVTGHIGLIDPATGTIIRRWSYTNAEDYGNDLSMSADGSLLGYWNYSGNTSAGRVLATSAPPGPDSRRVRIVVRNVLGTVLSASGRRMYALLGSNSVPANLQNKVLAAYDTANGRRITVLRTWSRSAVTGSLIADPAGGYALMSLTVIARHVRLPPSLRRWERACFARFGHKDSMCDRKPTEVIFVSINLATGALTTLPFHEPEQAQGIVAW